MKPLCHVCVCETLFLVSKNNFDLYKCSLCSLVFVYPQPSSKFLLEEVYSAKSGYQANKEQNLSRVKLSFKKIKVLDFLLKNIKGGRFLDVGCSNGDLLWFAQKASFDVWGVELNKRTADIAKKNGISVFNGFLEDAPFEDNFFDCIYLGDLIEHVNDPSKLLLHCKKILRSGGLIIISTPNLDCFWAQTTWKLYKFFSIPWSSITPPHHLFQFSVKNLDMLAHNVDLKKISMWFERPPRLLYELGATHLVKKYKYSRKIKDAAFLIFSFVLYTLMYVVDFLLTPFFKNNFGMIGVYKKR